MVEELPLAPVWPSLLASGGAQSWTCCRGPPDLSGRSGLELRELVLLHVRELALLCLTALHLRGLALLHLWGLALLHRTALHLLELALLRLWGLARQGVCRQYRRCWYQDGLLLSDNGALWAVATKSANALAAAEARVDATEGKDGDDAW